MSRTLHTNNHGQVEVDPFDCKGKYARWLSSITRDGNINFHAEPHISPVHSEVLTRYILDLASGKNMARGHKKGPRSDIHLVNARIRLSGFLRLLEAHTGRQAMDFTEDELLRVFKDMRAGVIKTRTGRSFIDVSSYAKGFSAFWHWYQRTEQDHGRVIPNLVQNLDTSPDHKPEWHHFTLSQVEKMADLAPYFEYKVLVFFLFDSGIRAPKELMNVRAKDIAPIPETNHAFLQIREETSKTFGRKIKLMISSDLVKKYIRDKQLQPNDFLFTNSPIVYNRVVAKLGYKVLGVGTPWHQRDSRGRVHKTLIKQGITMYDFRHNSVCHYLPIYKSENQLKYRYGWKKADMIHYYSEYLGMKDTITEDDMLVDTTKTQLEQALAKEQHKVAIMEERMTAKEAEMEERVKKLETMLLQRFAKNY